LIQKPADDRLDRLPPARSIVFDTYSTPAAETVVDRPLPDHLAFDGKAISHNDVRKHLGRAVLVIACR